MELDLETILVRQLQVVTVAEMLAPVVLGEAGSATLPPEFSPARFGP